MKFSLKPVFVSWIAFVAQLPIQIFLTLWCTFFLGSLLKDFFGSEENARLFFGIIAFLGIPAIFLIARKLNYDRTEYRFFDDRVEFEEGFFTIQKKTVRYADVREITLRRGILQRTVGLGTVYLATLATGAATQANPFAIFGFGNASASGIYVRDIMDPESGYEKIRAVVNPQTRA